MIEVPYLLSQKGRDFLPGSQDMHWIKIEGDKGSFDHCTTHSEVEN